MEKMVKGLGKTTAGMAQKIEGILSRGYKIKEGGTHPAYRLLFEHSQTDIFDTVRFLLVALTLLVMGVEQFMRLVAQGLS